MGMTLAESILAHAAGRRNVAPGDVLEPAVDLALSHENAALVLDRFLEIHKGLPLTPRLWDPDRIAIVFDHRVPAESSKTANMHRRVREFVRANGIRKFHEIRGDDGGICHQILPENGYVKPGAVVVGTDPHTTTHGAIGALGWGIGATEMAAVWALGFAPNVEVPATIRVVLEGALQNWVSAKDIILHLISRLTAQGANNRAIEFHGPAAHAMRMCGRLTLCNMAAEAGATAALFPADDETTRYLRDTARSAEPIFVPEFDRTASVERELVIDVSNLEPLVACPHAVDNVKPVAAVEGTRIDQVVVGSCTNGRIEDLAVVARLLKGHKVARATRMLVFPASARVYREALQAGYLNDMIAAGAVVMNAGCGCCLGAHEGALADGETALSTTNRNFLGRMGNPSASIYLCSPAVAAASAIAGVITDPRKGGHQA